MLVVRNRAPPGFRWKVQGKGGVSKSGAGMKGAAVTAAAAAAAAVSGAAAVAVAKGNPGAAAAIGSAPSCCLSISLVDEQSYVEGLERGIQGAAASLELAGIMELESDGEAGNEVCGCEVEEGVLVRWRRGDEGERQIVVGPTVACHNETDIFWALGLSYVPPHMRNMAW